MNRVRGKTLTKSSLSSSSWQIVGFFLLSFHNLLLIWIVSLSFIDSNGVHGLQCNSCAGLTTCEELMVVHPERAGRCYIGEGKCFIRKDPNGVLYWGCIDDAFWPGVPWRLYNGCIYDWDHSWVVGGVRRPMIWCFCNVDGCNDSIDRVNATNWYTTIATVQPSTAMTPPVTSPWPPAATTSQPTVSCPASFIMFANWTSCYLIVTPVSGQEYLALTPSSALNVCQSFNPLAHLLSLESISEQILLAGVLRNEPKMLAGWQGWWTSGKYEMFSDGQGGAFAWQPSGDYFSTESALWGFVRQPYKNTCVWIMSIPYYNQTLGNYDCSTKSGYICELDTRPISGDP